MASAQQVLQSMSLVRPGGKEEKTDLHLPCAPRKGVQATGSAEAQSFWLNAAKLIDWVEPPSIAYGKRQGDKRPSWFPDGRLNACYNMLDRHCKPTSKNPHPGARPCIHYESVLPQMAKAAKAGHGTRSLSYDQVLQQTKLFAGVLRHVCGVKKGDRVLIYMPMCPEAAIAILATARLGAIHSVVFGGFAPKELAKRIEDAEPRVVVAASCGIEPKGVIDYKKFVDESFEIVGKRPPGGVVMLRRTEVEGHKVPELSSSKGEIDWRGAVAKVEKERKAVEECEPVDSGDLQYILYTSGSTGKPKGVARATGGNAVGLAYSMQHGFAATKDDTIFCASDLGWVVGHAYILYAPLLIGSATIIFEGKPILPDAGIFWSIIAKHRVSMLYTAPTALRAIRREDKSAALMRKHDISSLRTLFLAGERSEPSIVSHYGSLLSELGARGAFVNDQYWSTEIGSPITAIQLSASYPPLRPRPGSAGLPVPGMDLLIVDDEGKEVKKGDMGNIVLREPLAPTALVGLWRNDDRYEEAYFKRFRGKGDYFDTGDAGFVSPDGGYVSVLSRQDDVINVAGHRIGTSLLEQVAAAHDLVAECCCVGLPDEMKGHVPFVVIARASSDAAQKADSRDILKAVNEQIRRDVGNIATLGGIATCRLPKTRSGKTLRRTIRELVENAAAGKFDAKVDVPPTIEDASTVEEARNAINKVFKSQQSKAKL